MKNGKGNLNESPRTDNVGDPEIIFAGIPKRKERKAAKLAGEYFEVRTILEILKQARSENQENEFLEFILGFSAKTAAHLYTKYEKIMGHGPLSIESGGLQ